MWSDYIFQKEKIVKKVKRGCLWKVEMSMGLLLLLFGTVKIRAKVKPILMYYLGLDRLRVSLVVQW